ncbi:MAG: hypothetical protein ACR2MY_15225 [Candidatus Dormibacteria bacterium]
MSRLSHAQRLAIIATLALAAGWAQPAVAGTPSSITIGPGPATVSYDGPALLGTDDPAGPSPTTCVSGACDREALTVAIPAGYTTSHVVGLKVTVTSSDGGGVDVTLIDSGNNILASNSGGTSPNSVALGDIQAGQYTIQVDGDIATGGTFNGVVTTSVANRSVLAVLPGGGLSAGRETVADPFRLGTEPNLAIGPDGKVYESPIFGFSTTQSFLQRSDDGGQTFHILGAPGTGKLVARPTAGNPTFVCTGGGDSDISTSPNNDLYFIDLGGEPSVPAYVSNDQGLNFTADCHANDQQGANVFTDRQWLATDTVHGREWYIYRDGLVSAGAPAPVDTFSSNAYGEYIKYAPLSSSPGSAGDPQLAFTSLCKNAGVDSACVTAVQTAGNAITDNFGPKKGLTYVAEKTAAGVGVIVINPDAATPATRVTERVAAPGANNILFATVAVDRGGNVYLAWVDAATYQVRWARSSDQGKTWSKPISVNGAPAVVNVMPWIVAGDAGRVDIVFYGSPSAAAPTTNYGPWNIYMVQTLNGTDALPQWSQAQLTDRPNHVDPICLSGLGCTTAMGPAGDRELGDFFRVALDSAGRAVVSFADGNNMLGSEVANGPLASPSFANLVRQATGPSLYAAQGDVPAIPIPTNSVSVGAHHNPVPFDLPPAGIQGADNDALNLTRSSLAYGDSDVTVRMFVKNLDATVATTPPALPTATYLTRWWYKGQIYYGAAEVTGGRWSFFSGQVAPISDGLAIKYAYYPASGSATGDVVTGPGGVINLHIPRDQVGSPPVGTPLYSITSYALTQALPTLPTPPGASLLTSLPQVADVLPPYNYGTLAGSGTPSNGGGGGGANPNAAGGSGLPKTAAASPIVPMVVLALAAALAAFLVTRRRGSSGNRP